MIYATILTALLAVAAEAAPSSPKTGKCTNPIVRKEWRYLEQQEKRDYIDAVLCLQTKPGITGLPNVQNLFDDFQAVHQQQNDAIHFVGHFALWHRYMVAEYERTLRDACGYKGAQPYWDWTLDASPTNNQSTSWFDSPVFDPETGLGGNGVYVDATPEQDFFNFTQWGRYGGGCVPDGPFTEPNFRVNVFSADGFGAPAGCLRRDFVPYVFNWFGNAPEVAKVVAQPDVTSFGFELEGVPTFTRASIHGSGHFGPGGSLGHIGDGANSPADPLFYLHHGNVDYIYWKWQQAHPEVGLSTVGGPIYFDDWPADGEVSTGPQVTLDFEINMGPIAPSRPLSQLLDTQGGVFCYTYADRS